MLEWIKEFLWSKQAFVRNTVGAVNAMLTVVIADGFPDSGAKRVLWAGQIILGALGVGSMVNGKLNDKSSKSSASDT